MRIIRGYWTVSYASATVLAASPPFDLQAQALRRVYHHCRGLYSDEDTASVGRSARDVREEARLETWKRWRLQLAAEDTVRHHHGADGAVLPNWVAWRDRGGLPLTYRMTQVLTVYGAFGEYLLRIRREVASTCHHCKEEEDMAQQTVEFCPAWKEPHRVLRPAIGERLATEAIVEAMLRGQQEYAVRS
jgi:hypothetical protein